MTINQKWDEIVQVLKDNASYLGISEKHIHHGLVGENADDKFTAKSEFIRVYVQMKPLLEGYEDHVTLNRQASLTVICGVYKKNTKDASKESFEMAERIERLLVSKGLNRESTQIFTLKNEGGISIHGVPFFFTYQSSAGDPNA